MISVVIVKVLRINFIWGFCMVDIYITSDEIKKYIFMIVLFNVRDLLGDNLFLAKIA